MSRAQQTFDEARPEPQHRLRAVETADRPLQFETIPNVCTIADVCRILRISARQFHYLDQRKELALVELRRLSRTRRFTGESVRVEARRRA